MAYRIMHFITRLIHGGADQNTIQTCIGLQNRGWEVALVTGKETSAELDYLLKQGVKIEKIECLERNVNLKNDLKALNSFYKLCKYYKPDIVHTHTAKAGIVGRIGAKAAKVPYVIHGIHGSPVDSIDNPVAKKLLSTIERITMFLNDYYISVGEDIFHKYCRQTRCKNTKHYKVVRSAFDVESFRKSREFRSDERSKYGLDDKHIAIGMISRIAPQKGYEYFLELCSKFNHKPHFKFFAAGSNDDDYYYRNIYNKSKSLIDNGNFTLLGHIPYNQMPRFISAMDIMVHTALWEGLPRAIVESLIGNKPVVCFNVDGAAEVILDGINGFIVQQGDVESMFKKIIEIEQYQSPEKYLANAESINNRIYNEYRVDVMIDKIESVYKMLLRPEETIKK